MKSHSIIDQHNQIEQPERLHVASTLKFTSEDSKYTELYEYYIVSIIFMHVLLSVIHAYDISLKASKQREHELLEKLTAAQHDSQEKDQKCSKLEDDMYDMQKKMAVSRDDYEQEQQKS